MKIKTTTRCSYRHVLGFLKVILRILKLVLGLVILILELIRKFKDF